MLFKMNPGTSESVPIFIMAAKIPIWLPNYPNCPFDQFHQAKFKNFVHYSVIIIASEHFKIGLTAKHHPIGFYIQYGRHPNDAFSKKR